MNDINHFSGIVKLLETPRNHFFSENKLMSKVRVQLPQARTPRIINLVFWGNLASDIVTYYKANDYILIEGYLGLPNKINSKKVEITVLKVYPLMTYSNQ